MLSLLVDEGLSRLDLSAPAQARRAPLLPISTQIVASLIFTAMWCMLCPLVQAICSRTRWFHFLKEKDHMVCTLKIVRSIYGIFVTIAAAVEVYIGQRVTDDILWSVTPSSELALLVSAGFFNFEVLSMFYTYSINKQWDNSLFVHHVLGMWGTHVITFTSCSHFFGLGVLIEEISTPFTFVSWILQKAGKSHTKSFLVNQFAMCTVWFFCRMCVDVYLWASFWSIRDRIMAGEANGYFLFQYTLGLFILTIWLNPYWMYMKTKKLVQVLKPRLVGGKIATSPRSKKD